MPITEKPKRKRTIKPTIRQTIAFNKLSEIIRNHKGKQKSITIGKILEEAGYSKEVSSSPTLVTKSKGFQELLEKYLPDDLVLETHTNLLKATGLDHYVFPPSTTDEEMKEIIESVPGCKLMKISHGDQWNRAYYWVPDNKSRKDAIDMAYKLKGSYKAEKVEHGVSEDLEKALERIRKILPASK
jgi:hypothetical protein